MKYYFAPVQGHTDAAYRHFHAKNYGGNENLIYTTPFLRVEKGEMRKKDFKDAFSSLNEGLEVIPQVIFRDREELSILVDILAQEGARRVDINMGCPFPLQTSRGRGAATVGRPECHKAVADVVNSHPEISFSVKMRLGVDADESAALFDVLNSLKLEYITVHPRTARDQYTSPLRPEAFAVIYETSDNPIVYNGDLLTPADAEEVIKRYPRLHGLMAGRGVLARPSLLSEIAASAEMPADERINKMLVFHNQLLSHYRLTLIGGEHQVLSKIKPFWEYAESEIGRKAWKAIKKASDMAKYQTALAMISNY